ncbi:hypothetical protein KKE06_02575 [Candidatus Micrarchaeota archaeon]|nr:hypothetical protein [Candidatus Micrarchaeota archaeon]MBU1929901.1 hypothetical protein [Candidatus Micrarchaeota archaeon]
MPKIQRILTRVNQKARETEKRLLKKISEKPDWHRYFPPEQMARLIAQTRQAEQPHQKELQQVSKQVLNKIFGLQASEQLSDFEITGDLAEGPKAHQQKPVSTQTGRRVLQGQQRVRALSEGMGLIAQDLFLQTLKREHPKTYKKLWPYYEPFITITRLAFHQPVSPSTKAMGLGEAITKIKYLKLQSKNDPEDIRIVPADTIAKVTHAPNQLLWLNEAAEALTTLSLKQSQAKMAFLKPETREQIEEQLHSLQLRQKRYQHGQHYFRTLNPLIQQIAQKTNPNAEPIAAIRHAWNQFLTLNPRLQDRLTNAYLRAKTTQQKKRIANAIINAISKNR